MLGFLPCVPESAACESDSASEIARKMVIEYGPDGWHWENAVSSLLEEIGKKIMNEDQKSKIKTQIGTRSTYHYDSYDRDGIAVGWMSMLVTLPSLWYSDTDQWESFDITIVAQGPTEPEIGDVAYFALVVDGYAYANRGAAFRKWSPPDEGSFKCERNSERRRHIERDRANLIADIFLFQTRDVKHIDSSQS